MNDDDRLAKYLADRAGAIDLAPGDASAVAARAERRRRNHRLAGAVVAATVIVTGAVVVFTGGTQKQAVNVGSSPREARTDLQWTSFDVPDGLGWSSAMVSADDGSIYGLSTAPGPIAPDQQFPKRALYRSTDGRSWTEATLPDGFSPNALATSADHLYAVGTAPAGGNAIDVVIASSTDGAQHWTQATIPTPRSDLKERFPTEVSIDPPVLAVGPSGLVAGVSVRVFPDVARLLPEVASSGQGYRFTASGIDVYAPIAADSCSPVQSTDSTSTDATEASVPRCAGSKEGTREEPAIERSYTWDEVGLEPELRQLIDGEVHLYTSADGTTFDEVAAPPTGGGYLSALVGGEDGYRLLTSSRSDGVHQQFSTDGQTWTSSGPDLEGWVQSSGSLAGTPAALVGNAFGATLLTAAPGGTWTALDLLAAVGVSTTSEKAMGLQDAAFGPLGFLAVVSTDGSPANTTVIDSADGQRFTTHSIAELAGDGDWMVAGLSMNADAVIVRLMPPGKPTSNDPANTPDPPGPQRLLVGTPN